jgi:hypothetical protein
MSAWVGSGVGGKEGKGFTWLIIWIGAIHFFTALLGRDWSCQVPGVWDVWLHPDWPVRLPVSWHTQATTAVDWEMDSSFDIWFGLWVDAWLVDRPQAAGPGFGLVGYKISLLQSLECKWGPGQMRGPGFLGMLAGSALSAAQNCVNREVECLIVLCFKQKWILRV